MKHLALIFILSFLVVVTFSNSYSGILISPSDFNLSIKDGAIDRNAMAQRQRDTIVVGVFDYEDDFEDIAVYHPSKKQIIVYKNLRNGFATPYRIIDMFEKNVKSIKGIYPEPNLESFHKRTGLEITMYDGSKEILTDFEIYRHGIPEIEKAMVPKWDMFEDPRIFIYELSFLQKWQSERNGVPAHSFVVGDIDKDGKDELIWTMYKIADPFPRFDSSRLVVFEYVDENNVRIDWDTILPPGGWNYGFGITDYDNDGNLEFMGASYFSLLQRITTGFFECRGERQYRYLHSGYDVGSGHPRGVEYRDSVTFNGVTAKGMWICNSFLDGSSTVRLLRFSGSNDLGLGFTTAGASGINSSCYHMSAGDLDRDGKEEIVLGASQWGGFTRYLDSTGSGPQGYEEILMNPVPPGAAGFSFFKDYNGDGFQELTIAGIGQGSGGLSIMKHTGEPGTNSYQIVYANTLMRAAPNNGIDTNYIDNEFCLLYGLNYYENFTEYQNTIIYQLSDTFQYEQIYFLEEDSIVYLSSRLYDLGNTGKINLITPIRFQGIYNSGNAFMTIFEREGPLTINTSSQTIPLAFELYQNYPNPFNNSTKISFEIHKPGKYSLEVFDISGRKITEIFTGTKPVGRYEETFYAEFLSSGVYFYRLSGEKFSLTKRMMLIK